MEAQRRMMAKARRRTDCTVKLVVACCVALLFLSPGLPRMLPARTRDSRAYLGRSAMLERKSVKALDVAGRSEMRGRVLDEVSSGGSDAVEDELTGDYSTPTHNHNLGDEDPRLPAAKTTSRYRTSHQARYTAQYGHRHLRGV